MLSQFEFEFLFMGFRHLRLRPG